MLLIVPSGSGSPTVPPPTTVIAGLPLVRRIALAGTRAGFDRLVIHGPSLDGALSGITAQRLPEAEAAERGRRRLVVLPDNVVPRLEWLRSLRSTPIEPDTLYIDASGAAALEATH